METHNNTGQQKPKETPPAASSCRKKTNEKAAFLEDLKDHMDEFIHASMEDHKSCFKNTMQKMFGMSKIVVAEKSASDHAKEVESSLPVRTD